MATGLATSISRCGRKLGGTSLATESSLMRLDLLIPTLERPALLRAALESVARAARPRSMDVSVTVINNGPEPLVLEPSYFAGPYPLRVLQERRRGKSAALNLGIAESTADYIGLIDDDEEIAADWLQVAERALSSGAFDFIGGPALLCPLREPPAWLPPGYPAVLGSADGGPDPVPYGAGFPGMLMGDNAVISRALLLTVGPYCTALGPRTGRRLGSCEDEDMYWRLIDAGARGQYLPGLVVHHHVHANRLRKSYYRSWSFWNGASKSVLSRRRPERGPQIAGLPRYVCGDVVRGALGWLGAIMSGGGPARRLAGELPAWHLAGRVYGRYLQRDETRRFGHTPAEDTLTKPLQYGDDRSIGESTTR
jgi:glycosyltransferase involved in cell wall biosynthesis